MSIKPALFIPELTLPDLFRSFQAGKRLFVSVP